MVKSILRKTKKSSKGKKHPRRVRFNKHKKVKTFKKNKAIKSKKSKKKLVKTRKGRKGKKGKKTRNGRKGKRLRLRMKGGCTGSNMGAKITGIKLNPQDYQHPESTNLNTSIPHPYQNGGFSSLLDTVGLGDIPFAGHNLVNSATNLKNIAMGNETVTNANPVVHPEMEKSLVKYPAAIDVKDMHTNSKAKHQIN